MGTPSLPKIQDMNLGSDDPDAVKKIWFAFFNELAERLPVKISSGTGSPESVVIGDPGDVYFNLSGGAGTTLYIKETGNGDTGWAGK